MAKRPVPFRNSEEKDQKGYFTYPLMVDKSTWFYEQPEGIIIGHEFRDDKSGILIEFSQITISWAHLCAAVDNHRRAERKRKTKAKSRKGPRP